MGFNFDPPIHTIQPSCPPDLFERMQQLYHIPEDYNHLISKTIADLCDRVAVSTPIIYKDGVMYIEDPDRGNKIMSLARPVFTTGWKGTAIKERYLQMSDVALAGDQGIIMPRKATITGMWAKSRSTGSWTMEVRKNGIPITVVSKVIVGGGSSDPFLDIDLDKDDVLQIYAAGSGIAHPLACVELGWRLDATP